MRGGDVKGWWAVIGMTAISACAWPLEDEAPRLDLDPPPLAGGCGLATRDGAVLHGVVRSLANGDQTTWTAASDETGRRDLLMTGAPGPTCESTLDAADAPLVAASSTVARAALDFAIIDGGAIAYFVEGPPDPVFGVRPEALGVAYGEDLTSLTPFAERLWTADRPPYGTSVVVDETYVYAFGCLAARFLDADCYAARVEKSQVGRRSAYTYWAGSERWVADPDRAFPVVTGGTHISVVYHPGRARYIMAYSQPLADRIVLRVGFGPVGPWSAPFEIGRCEPPADDPDAFCTGVELHPSVVQDDDRIAVTYALGSFSDQAISNPAAYRTRLAVVSLPAELP